MRIAVAVIRIALAIAIVVGVVATHLEAASRVVVNPFNLYGYFTIQSNIFVAVVLLILGGFALAGRRPGRWLSLLRALATTYIVIVGIVYATLLAPLGEIGGVPIPWVNFVHHILAPILVALDWLLVGDRVRIPLSRFWVVLIYPAVWLTVVLIRGATDGWVPYPFLDPKQGYGAVALYAVAILAVFVVIGLLVLWASRFRGVLLRR